jgi:hypothetical protein
VREYLHSLLKNVEGDYDGVGCGIDLGVDCDAGHEVFILSSSTYRAGTNLWTRTKRFCELDKGLIRGHVEVLQARELTLQRLPCLGVGDIVGPTGFNLAGEQLDPRASSSGVRVAIRSPTGWMLIYGVGSKFLRATLRESLHARKRATLRAARKGGAKIGTSQIGLGPRPRCYPKLIDAKAPKKCAGDAPGNNRWNRSWLWSVSLST